MPLKKHLGVFRSFVSIAAILIIAGAQVGHAGLLERLFAPKAKLWPVWSQHQPGSNLEIDHGLWDRFLRNNVAAGEDDINRIPYAMVSTSDRESLSLYLSKMESVPISQYSREQQLAYWINLYNALTVSVVLRHYPVATIRDINISGGLFAKGPWAKKLLIIEGEAVSLNDIEHRILRPIWNDPRIHYAVNCASIGCPNLQMQAFTGGDTETLLNESARGFINHRRGARVENNRLYVSSIYDWFRDDFGGNTWGVIQHLRQYANPALLSSLEDIRKISGSDYDWALNELTR